MSERGMWLVFFTVLSAFITVLAAYGFYHLVSELAQ